MALLEKKKINKIEAVTAPSMIEAALLPRGLRNKNPGNIRISGVAWRGKIPKANNTDGSFEQFDTMENGIRAAYLNLRTYFHTYNLRTIRGIITRWAPSSENNTNAYIQAVAGYTKILPDFPFNWTIANATNLLFSIFKHENGNIHILSEDEIKKVVTANF